MRHVGAAPVNSDNQAALAEQHRGAPNGVALSTDPPFFRSSIILRALTWKSSNSPAHAHRRC